ncbi:Alpha/Beta hydrolase protein [Amylocarpus encephaloides]|uniref:Carboxylic ester hydrolase n=1 Tax=Amylocarpus encephaloides TaxID=45428 RepID=A0A9P7Y7N6_9HELO|nr:Alpha/Beta hydrolase protein [Amylocarpus encephaloides]
MTLKFTTIQALVAILAFQTTANAGKTQQVSNWGDNPSRLPPMMVYTPDKIAEKPAIILGLHPCGGNGQQYYRMTSIPSYADRLGFIVLYPTSNSQNGMNCWDANTAKSLTHDGGGDSQGLAGMVKWALNTYNGDPSKVFAIGGSSGAMEANVLAATYPDVFNAAVSYSGVPAACWAGSPISTPFSSDLSCPLGKKASTYSAQQWGDLAKGCYPGYSGTRTRMMIVHGTSDTAVVISLLKAQLDQWSNVMGLSFSKNITNDPIMNWKKIEYGDGSKLIGYEVQGGGHIPPFQGDATMKFLGLM